MNVLNRTQILSAAVGIFCGLSGTAVAADATKPNVVVILADDLGYADLGIQGGKDIPTPNLDALGRGSTRFNAGYVTCPVCAPTRAGLLTGRYQQRFGFEENGSVAEYANYGLEKSEKTIADSFKAAGYATAAVGKWHLGEPSGYQPNDRGFDEFYGFHAGANDYTPYTDLAANAKSWLTSAKAQAQAAAGNEEAGFPKQLINGRRFPLYRQREVVAEPGHLSEAFAREGVSFIERQSAANKPFFLYLALNAAHVPFSASPKYQNRFTHLPEGRREYAALLASLDEAVGRVTATLREKNLEQNTIIFFASDNGGASAAGPGGLNYSNNGTLRARKNQMYEGGIRVPYFVQWKGTLPADKTIDTPVSTLDVLPTALAAAGARHVGEKALDGVNLLPLLRGETTAAPHENLFWRMKGRWAARDAQWKIVRWETGRVELFDLLNDGSETKDVSAANPAIVERLRSRLDAWDAQLEPARWTKGPIGDRKKKKAETAAAAAD